MGRRDSGQSTVEFALTLLLMVAFTLFFFQLAVVSAFGNFAHYATFMAGRAYQAAGPTKEDQYDRALAVFQALMMREGGSAEKFPFIAKGEGEGDPKGLAIGAHSEYSRETRAKSWLQGVRYTFKSKLFLIPLGSASGGGGVVNAVKLTSESWLGREPSYSECQADMATQGIFDNGC